MTDIPYQVFSLNFRDKQYQLKKLFHAAEISGVIFDAWYHRSSISITVPAMDKVLFQCLKGYLNNDKKMKEHVKSGLVSDTDIRELALEWQAPGMLDWFGIDRETALFDDIRATSDKGGDTTKLEKELHKRLVAGNLSGLRKCPFEIVFRAGRNLPAPIRVRIAKELGGMGCLFLEAIDVEQLSDADVQGLEQIPGGRTVLDQYKMKQQMDQMAAAQKKREEELKAEMATERKTEAKKIQAQYSQIVQNTKTQSEQAKAEDDKRHQTEIQRLQTEIQVFKAEIKQLKSNETTLQQLAKRDSFDGVTQLLKPIKDQLQQITSLIESQSSSLVKVDKDDQNPNQFSEQLGRIDTYVQLLLKLQLPQLFQDELNSVDILKKTFDGSYACTYAITGTEYAPQLFYQCEQCGLVGDMGCCVHCAMTCHQGHKLTFRGMSQGFFCDCGHGAGTGQCCLIDSALSRKLQSEK